MMARPFVPNRPARLKGMNFRVCSRDAEMGDIPDAMQITVCIWGTVIVDYNVHPLDVDPTTKDVRCNQYTLFECLKGGVSVDTARNRSAALPVTNKVRFVPLLLLQTRVDADTGKIA